MVEAINAYWDYSFVCHLNEVIRILYSLTPIS